MTRWPALALAACLILLSLCSGCSPPPATCPKTTRVGSEEAEAIAADESLPFRFPLDPSEAAEGPSHAWFGEGSIVADKREYHAAEDYRRPAGTPVYAMADGRVSYSGRAGGYGWLVIVDHPLFNLYSLYGHLSPSRWSHDLGPVSKGELLGYLGDPDENGGSPERPLEPHLHLGLRAGQRADYPGRGEWRWMAGWITLCPQDLGWLQPSLVITTAAVPASGYPAPDPGFLVRWGAESLITLAYTATAVGILVAAMRRRSRFLLLLPGLLLVAAGIILRTNRMLTTDTLLVVGILLSGIGVWRLVAARRP